MSSQQMREEFETWFKSALAQLVRCGAVDRARDMEVQKPTLQLVWEESRAALEIDVTWFSCLTPGGNPLEVINACRAKIEKAGVRVKP